MNLKGRLSRLGPVAPLSPSERPADTPPPASVASAPAAESPSAVSPLAAKNVLDELRSRMAAMLQREAPVALVRQAADLSELPFERVETPHGPLTQRLLVLPPSHHVGRIPVESAREVRPELLALLALDPRLAAVNARGALYLDTETTGLGGAGTVAFLVGLAWFNSEGRLVLEQLLLAGPDEEVALLLHLRQRVEEASLLVTFNGKSFDWPLLQARTVMAGQRPFPERPHLDLLHVGRRLHKARLGRCRLIHLEAEVLGWERGHDDIPGADIAPLYGHFLRSGRGELLLPVVEHNAWDVITMAALVGLYGEPVGLLHPEDLLGLAQSALRARAYDEARLYADASLEQGGGPEALRKRAQIEKARGDKARALLDFEALSAELTDPAVRLELCKLYEHHAKDFEAALRLLGAGTGEGEVELDKRRQRLTQKRARQKGPRAPHSRGRRS